MDDSTLNEWLAPRHDNYALTVRLLLEIFTEINDRYGREVATEIFTASARIADQHNVLTDATNH